MRKTGSLPVPPQPPTQAGSPAEPWEALQQLLAENRRRDILPFLSSLAPGETARAISRLNEDDRQALLTQLDPDEAAGLIEGLPSLDAADLIEDLPARQAAAIVEEMPSDHQADLLGDLEDREAQAILDQMAPRRATTARRLLAYQPESAGGLMIAEFLAYPDTGTIGDVVADLRTHGDLYSGYNVQYTFVVAGDGRLAGVLRVRDLLLSPPHTPLRNIMLPDPLRVVDTAPLDVLKGFFDEHPLFGVPVVDPDGRLVGIVRRTAVEEAVQQGTTRTLLAMAGLSGEEELRTMPLGSRAVKRLSWLSLNIVLNVIAASIIALYQDTLSAVVALAVFLPIISDMSGCSGSQSVAVSIRELTLGLIRPYEFMRVVWKEGAVGVLNGVILGLLLGALAFLWKQNIYLSLVVATALSLNTVVAVLVGGSIPLLLKRMKLDPALASGPILTTVTDMCGFFFVLSFATVVLSKLTGA